MNVASAISPEELLVNHLDKTPFALIAWDADMRISAWSHQAERLFGWKEEEVKGKSFTDFPFVYEEDLELVGKNVARLLNGETDRFTDTNRNLRKDGSVVHCIWYGYVLKDGGGRIQSFFSLAQDVTEKTRQEVALKQVNERLSLLTNATNDGIWEWDAEHNRVWANETFRTTYGYNPQDYPNFYDEWLSRMHPEDREAFLQDTAAVRERRGKTWSGEFRFRLADGSYGTILQKVHFVYGPGGQLQKAVGVDINVTNLRQTEAALRLSEEKFSKAFRSSPVPLNILRLADNTFTDVNDAYCRLVGYGREELIGRAYRDLHMITEQSVQEALNVLRRQGSISNLHVEMIRKDGSTLHCLISADILIIDGERHLLTTLFDTTEQVKAEAALRLNEQQLEMVYNTVSDLLFLLEVEGEGQYRFITANDSFLLRSGLKREQVEGHRVQEVLPRADLPQIFDNYLEAIVTKKTVQWEHSSPYSDRTGIVSITPVFDDKGACIRLVGAIHDISEQKRASEELSRSYEEIRLLASHLQDIREEERTLIAREIHDELGQLLTALKMEVSWLRRTDTLSAEQVARRVQSASALLDEAINTVRSISAELRPSILDDLGLVEALAWQSREFEKRYGVPVRFLASVPEVRLSKDVATAFFRIFQEALTNVARHAKARHVEAGLALSDGVLSLQVTDDGIGFEQDKIEAKKTLGLVGIRERIAAINGRFQLQTAPGTGTTITITVPYTPPVND